MAKSATQDSTVVMDSRKFLGALNDSAQAKVAEFEGHIHEMGQKAGKNWRLTALKANDLYIEDIDTSVYYIAEHKTERGKVTITNIRPIQIQEGEKQQVFGEACGKLIDAIEENDQRSMQSAFNRMRSHKFSGRSVPYSGFVRCRDNVTRKVNISSSDSLSEDVRNRLIAAIVEGLRDQVIVENGHIVSASFSNGDPVKLPVTKWAARKLVAKKMRTAAEGAYWSEGFQTRIKHIAQLVLEGNIDHAVKFITPFLDDMEEFTLLTRAGAQTLIENSLAANSIFNQSLCDDTATLFHRTNLRVNRRKIIDEWRNISKKAEHAVLAENVQILESANNFEAAYNKFLELIFEAISNKEVAAEALATTLEVLKNKTPRIKESHDLSSKLDNLIARLKEPSFDDAAIYEAEDLIATIQEELAATETLGNFDQMPGGDDMGLGLDEPVEDPAAIGGGEGAPVININSPLIQIGGSSSAGEGGEELGGLDDLAAEPPVEEPIPGEEEMMGGGEEGDLAALLGGGAPAAPAGGMGLESKQKRRKSVNESRPKHYEMADDEDDDDASGPGDELDESYDPYAIRESELKRTGSLNASSYGAPVITDQKQLRQIVGIMNRLAEEHNLTGSALQENLESMAEASIQATGLRVPKGRMPKAMEQAIEMFSEMVGTGTSAVADTVGGGATSSDDDDVGDDDLGLGDDDDLGEDQFKGPRIRGRGFKKTAYQPRELKNESIQWGEKQDDAILGQIGDVRFIFDHGGADDNLKPIIMSEDGSVEIPIPEELYNDAFASANMIEEGDSTRFASWLAHSLTQLRPITSEEDRALEEAMAKITTTPDGGLSVEVSDDADVGELGMDDGMGMGDEEYDTAGMEPVDAVDGEMDPEMAGGEMGAGELGAADETMPDYEDDDALAPGGMPPEGGEVADVAPGGEMAPPAAPAAPAPAPAPAAPAPEEEEPRFEDKDVTEPQSGKYTKHVKDNKRDMPDHKMTKTTDDNLDSIGPDLKVDDGSGTKPPTAKSMSNK